MSTAQPNPALGRKVEGGFWLAVALLEAGSAACSMALIAFGPFFRASTPWLWLVGAATIMAAYLAVALWATRALLSAELEGPQSRHLLLAGSSLPFLAGFSFTLALLLFRPAAAGVIWLLLSPIQPFPILAMALGVLLVFLLKAVAVSALHSRRSAATVGLVGAADSAIAASMLVMGVFQATVYITPIGNAFLRFWAIADAPSAWTSYPVSLTEPGPVSAGSPPYVYDLPLFPLMLRAAFALLGHNSAAAHLPAAFWSALFPLSVYLLIREATGSRVTGALFGTLISLFPYLRIWVLNLPDPDPLLLTSLCFAAYLYLRALASPRDTKLWIGAGVGAGVAALARPEGLLYAGCLALGVLACRPGLKQVGLYLLMLGLLLGPVAALWEVNFGFLWPQNYNRTLRLDYPLQNYGILEGNDSLGFYQRGLGLDTGWALGILLLFVLAVAAGTVVMLARDRRLLAIAVPGIGNTVTIFFANPYIPNTFHYIDFFRHACFGIPFMVVTAAYGLHQAYRFLARRGRLRPVAYLALLLLVAATIRESDILANPTATHRPGATQVLATYTYLSMQDILRHPMPLPPMTYMWDGNATVVHPTGIAWPEDAQGFFKPLDMAFDSNGRPFGYASAVSFLLALAFAALAHRTSRRHELSAPLERIGVVRGS